MAERNLTTVYKGDDSSLTAATRRAIRNVDRLTRATGALTGQAAALGAGLAVAGVAGLAAWSKLTGDAIDKQQKLALNTVETVSNIQLLNVVSDLGGTSIEKSGKALQFMTRALGEARDGNKRAGDAVKALGFDLDELRDVTPLDAMRDFGHALGQMDDQQAAAQISAALFGGSWKELRALFSDDQVFDQVEDALTKLGLLMSDDAAGGVAEMNDQVTMLGVKLDLFNKQILAAFAPFAGELLDVAGQALDKFITGLGGGERAAQALALVVLEKIPNALDVAGQAMDEWFPRIKVLLDIVGFMLDAGIMTGQLAGGAVATGVQLAQGNLTGAGAVVQAVASDVAPNSTLAQQGVAGTVEAIGEALGITRYDPEAQQRALVDMLDEQRQQTRILHDLNLARVVPQ